MLNSDIKKIIADSHKDGWVVEPLAKQILKLSGISVAPFEVADCLEDARQHARKLGYPLAAKVVSPLIMHKSDLGGVVLGIKDEVQLAQVLDHFKQMEGFAGVHLESMAAGTELIIGAKNDYQFGPVVMLGLGGTGVEIYQDVALRMAPVTTRDVDSMLRALKAREILQGYRGGDPINTEKLTTLMLSFSEMAMTLEPYFESIDLNPVLCSSADCVIADARIVLKKTEA